MKLNTKYHGTKEFKEEDIIKFKKGMPGFEELRKFILFPVEDNAVFSILHSLENKNIGFVVVSPFYSIENYEFNIGDEITNELEIDSYEDVLVLNTVTLSSQIENITINSKAPIIINIKKKLGEQIILDNPEYSTKYPLF